MAMRAIPAATLRGRLPLSAVGRASGAPDGMHPERTLASRESNRRAAHFLKASACAWILRTSKSLIGSISSFV
jgi:hypothetical protein